MNAQADFTPMTADAGPGWAELNQRWLVAEIGRLRRWIESRAVAGRDETPTLTGSTAWSGDAAMPPAVERIAQLFELSRFEREALLLAAGVELDPALAALVAEASPQGPNFALFLDWLPKPHLSAATSSAPLRRWRLLRPVEPGVDVPLLRGALRIDEFVLQHVLGLGQHDDRLAGVVHLAGPAGRTDESAVGCITRALIEQRAGGTPRVLVTGPACFEIGWDAAVTAVRQLGFAPWSVAVEDLVASSGERDEILRLLDRQAALSSGVLILRRRSTTKQGGEVGDDWLLDVCDRLCSPLVVVGALDPSQLRCARERWTTLALQSSDAAGMLKMVDERLRGALLPALQQFQVDAALVDRVVGNLKSPGEGDDLAQIVWQELRVAARGGLDALAQRIESRTRLDDLVLPPGAVAQLRDVLAQVRYRHLVYEQWGLGRASSRGLGIAALFAGESGTGKTMAAEAIANEARLDLYRIDLASTVSKYIGETEKNLARLFEAAEASGAVLLFDEADALFGKRSEVKDSHDRYANIEIAYLLQRIEAYRGLAILTTNMKASLDKAFLRRIRFVVNFGFPDQVARLALWKRQYREGVPVAPSIDWLEIAALQLSGGHIRAAALNAAFLAASEGAAIGGEHIRRAARAELTKLERSAG